MNNLPNDLQNIILSYHINLKHNNVINEIKFYLIHDKRRRLILNDMIYIDCGTLLSRLFLYCKHCGEYDENLHHNHNCK